MAERLAASQSDDALATRLLTFEAAGELYALTSDVVREIIRPAALAQVPLGSSSLLGLANLRGTVLPVISLARLFQFDAPIDSDVGKLLVLDRSPLVALHVDDVQSFVEVDTARISPASTPSLLGIVQPAEHGVPIKILDLATLLAVPDSIRAASTSGRPRRQALQQVESADQETVMAFEVAGQEFALPIANVLEVLPALGAATPLPHSDPASIGMVALRESLLPAFSLRTLLGLASAENAQQRMVVAEIGGASVGLAVDNITQIVRVPRDMLEAVPPVIANRAAGEAKLGAIVKLDNGRRLISVLSPDQLFREDVMSRIRRDRAQVSAAATAEASRLFLVFTLGGQEYGLAIDAVQEVSRLPEHIAPLPQAPDFLRGVINLRGSVVPIIDQSRRFGLSPNADTDKRRLIIIRIEGRIAGFIVDGVSEVLRAPASAVSPPPQVAGSADYLEGVINLDQSGRMILLLDPAKLLTRTEVGLLDALGSVNEAQPAIDQATGRR